MKMCPFCAKENQDAATVCERCGRNLPVPVTAPARAGTSRVVTVVVAAVVAVIVGLLFLMAAPGG